MWADSKLAGVVFLSLGVFLSVFAFGQTQTTGRIAGTVRDTQGAVVAGAEGTVENFANADKRSGMSDTRQLRSAVAATGQLSGKDSKWEASLPQYSMASESV